MKRHEWTESTEEGTRHFRATCHGGKWELKARDEKGEEWRREEPISLASLHQLRDVLFRKYQRRRVPYEHVAQIEKLIEAAE